ncbi:glycine zipper 2TM domain-containing protein [Candidatus Nucleicultrix amoebiphila]|jgi:uncharacterized protein YcfJ|uniref:glycine zipper 2TM domain-containing protein n=1 Tax=Candidatus Nucleicultrix amoebiphila TaxID=1509244 RepID=UPI001E41E17F|nr:glycine zipper 2TM domain-containing protein [Candidatus Nucleicultrix amoebiphila]
MKMKSLSLLVAMSFLLSACGTTGGPKQTAGTLIGAAGGALIGSQIGGGRGAIVGAAVGTAAGALAGGYVGKQMDDSDKKTSSRPTY